MEVNVSKTNAVHFRKLNQTKTNYYFKCGNINIAVTDRYKYLGCVLNDTLYFSVTANVLSEAAGRGLGSLINKIKNSKGLLFKTYTNLYDKCVVPMIIVVVFGDIKIIFHITKFNIELQGPIWGFIGILATL